MNEGKNIIILGKRGHGKTSLARYLIEKCKRKTFILNPVYPHNYDKDLKFTFETFKDINLKKKKIQLFSRLEEYEKLLLYLQKQENINIFIDELYFFKGIFNQILEFVRYGRQRKINLILISRRPQEFTPDILSQFDILYIGKIQNIRDFQYLQQSIQDDINIIKSLEKFKFLIIGEYSQSEIENLL